MDHSVTPASHSRFKQRYLPWIVWVLGCLFYFYEFLLQVSPGVMAKELMRDFQITSHTLGFVAGVYFYSYSPMQLPGGLLMDYFGPKRLLTLACGICAVSTIAFSMTNSLLLVSFARLAIGFGSAFAAVGTMKLSSNWFPANRFAFLTGLMVTIGMLGAIGGEVPLALLIDAFGWRKSMFILGCAGLAIALLMQLVMTDAPQYAPTNEKEPVSERRPHNIFHNLLIIIRNKQLWLIAIYGGLMYMSTPVLCGLWGVPFLTLKLNVSKVAAAFYTSFILLGWAAASPFWGYISNRIGRRKPPMYLGTLGALLTLLTLIYTNIQNVLVIQTLLMLFGIFSAGFLPSFATAKEVSHEESVAAGLGFMNMMNMVGIAIALPLIGYILDLFWTGGMHDGARAYTIETYHIALGLLPLGILLALIILPFINETYCKNIHEH